MIFRDEAAEYGAISQETFDAFAAIIQRYIQAQEKFEAQERDWDVVFSAIQFEALLEELPHEKDRIMAVWQKVKFDLANVPFVLCHGDFNAHNILPGGVIDFETAFNGPKGYDTVSAAVSIEWFPTEGNFEILGKYAFTLEQKHSLLSLRSESIEQLDALSILRAIWLVVRMHQFPKLQAWRYAKFETLMNEYLNV